MELRVDFLKKWARLTAISLAVLATTPVIAQENIPENKQTESIAQIEVRPSPEEWGNVRLVHTLKGHTTVIDSLSFSVNGQTLISGGSENEPLLRFWSVETGRQIDNTRAQRSAILSIAVTPNGQTLVSSGSDGAINLWNWSTGEFKAIFLQHQTSVLSLAITPDSQTLISGGLDGIKVWNLNPQRPYYTLVGVGNPIYEVAIHPNGYILASGDNNGRVRLWNLRDAEVISDFKPHQQRITGLAFSADGNTLVTSSVDATIKVWDVPTGILLYTFTGHSNRIRSIALNPDGKTLATASNDGVRLWNIRATRSCGV